MGRSEGTMRVRTCGAVLAALLAVLASGPAGAGDERPRPLPGSRAVAEPPPAVTQSSPDYDPWQGVNRKIFAFNDTVDRWVLAPVATGWDKIMPQCFQTGISNFFANLRFPIDLVNNLLQLKPIDSATVVGRFAVNTVAGMGGFLDQATPLGLRAQPEDFGQTLGHWGVPMGPYLVIPVLGPSTLRDAPALAVDSAAAITPFFVDVFILVGARMVDIVNTRAAFLEEVSEARATSLDFYVFVRNAYLQRRRAEVEDRSERTEPERTPPYDDSDLYTVP
jgi:phospholipid-binding lipoprotein MlaA